MNPPQQGIKTAEAIEKLRSMQSQIIHGSNIFGDIANLLASIEQENQRLREERRDLRDHVGVALVGVTAQLDSLQDVTHPLRVAEKRLLQALAILEQQALATDTKDVETDPLRVAEAQRESDERMERYEP